MKEELLDHKNNYISIAEIIKGGLERSASGIKNNYLPDFDKDYEQYQQEIGLIVDSVDGCIGLATSLRDWEFHSLHTTQQQ